MRKLQAWLSGCSLAWLGENLGKQPGKAREPNQKADSNNTLGVHCRAR